MPNIIDITRHASIFDPEKMEYPVHIIGAGATGSRVFAALVELGLTNIKVYDPDVVEEHNLANQIYTTSDIGEYKTFGCAKFVKQKLNMEAEELPKEMDFIAAKINGENIISHYCHGGIVFLLTDTMKSRKDIMDGIKTKAESAIQHGGLRMKRAPILVIETRMASTHGSVFTINPFDSEQIEQWESTLVDDTDEDNIEVSPCGTTLSVGTTASLIANYAVWQMMQFYNDPVGMQNRIDLFFQPTLTVTAANIAA